MIIIVEFKWNMTSIGIFRIIIYKFSYQKEICLIFLLIIYKNLKIRFHNTILHLNLAINLRKKNNEEF